MISEVLVKFRGKERVEVRLRLGSGIHWLELGSSQCQVNGSQCKVLTRMAARLVMHSF